MYNLSKDYALLWDLVANQGLQVACFIDYGRGGDIFRDLCLCKRSKISNIIEFTSRGICYGSSDDFFDGSERLSFISVCEMSNVEFIPSNIIE